MESTISIFLTIVLAAVAVLVLMKLYFNNDRRYIWSPLTFITLTYLYYCVIPTFTTNREFEGFDTGAMALNFHIGALLSFCAVLFGFYIVQSNSHTNWKKWNSCFNTINSKKIALILFGLALLCYVPFRGFKFNVFSTGSEMVEYDWDNQGLNYYFVGMISLFITSCCLLLAQYRNNKILFIIILWLTLVTYIVSGFRYRIVILVISLFTMYYLCDTNRKIRVVPILLLAVVCYIGFNVMDHARSYGNGISKDLIQTMSREELTSKAGETERVYNFSIMVMQRYAETGKKEYFEPIINAICMPLPRVIFPWKPKAEYLYNATGFVMHGGEIGSAYVNFVEAFMSFGWIGIFINGVFLGWLARRFWNNYKNNPTSCGAILALGLFNGFTYVVVSRGYLAQEFNIFLYFICLPFWITIFLKRIFKF